MSLQSLNSFALGLGESIHNTRLRLQSSEARFLCRQPSDSNVILPLHLRQGRVRIVERLDRLKEVCVL